MLHLGEMRTCYILGRGREGRWSFRRRGTGRAAKGEDYLFASDRREMGTNVGALNHLSSLVILTH